MSDGRPISMLIEQLIDVKVRQRTAQVSGGDASRLAREHDGLCAAIDRGWPRQAQRVVDPRGEKIGPGACVNDWPQNGNAEPRPLDERMLADALGAALYGVEKFSSNDHWIAMVKRVLTEFGLLPPAPLSPESAAKLDAGIADSKAGRIVPAPYPFGIVTQKAEVPMLTVPDNDETVEAIAQDLIASIKNLAKSDAEIMAWRIASTLRSLSRGGK